MEVSFGILATSMSGRMIDGFHLVELSLRLKIYSVSQVVSLSFFYHRLYGIASCNCLIVY